MKAVFQIVFEMTSFFIIFFADHVIVIIHPYTVYHSQYLCRLHGSHDNRVGIDISTLPKVEFVAQDTWDNWDQLQKYMF